jgi:hypothetical protein
MNISMVLLQMWEIMRVVKLDGKNTFSHKWTSGTNASNAPKRWFIVELIFLIK